MSRYRNYSIAVSSATHEPESIKIDRSTGRRSALGPRVRWRAYSGFKGVRKEKRRIPKALEVECQAFSDFGQMAAGRALTAARLPTAAIASECILNDQK